MIEHDLDVAGYNVHVYDWVPSGRARDLTVVYLHGFGDSGACTATLGRDLSAAGFRAVFPDAPAHGKSDLTPEFTEWSRAASARAVIEQVTQVPIVLGGHSMGGETAAIVASQLPELVRTLVLEEPAMWFRDGTTEEQAAGAKELFDWINGLQNSTHEERVGWARNDGPTWDEAEYVPWAESKAALNLRLLDGPYSWLGSEWQEVAGAVRVPTLLMRGAPSKHTLNPDDAAIFTSITGAVDLVLPTAHCVRREQPLAFTSALLGVLAALS